MTSQPPEGPIQGEVLPPTGTPETNSLAVVSLVAGIASIVLAAGSIFVTLVCCAGLPLVGLALILGIAAAICGHVALRQLRETNQRGREMAIGGLITGYASVGLSLVMVLLMVLGIGLFAAAAAAGTWEVQ